MVAGNGSLTPICSLSKRSLSPSLTVYNLCNFWLHYTKKPRSPCIEIINKCVSSIHRIASKEINMQPICNRSWPRTKSHFLFILWTSNFSLLQWDIWKLGRCQNVLSRLCHEALLGQTQSHRRQPRFYAEKSAESGAWPYRQKK